MLLPQEALRALPAARHVEMLLIKEELDNAAREAAAADAAVAAVAKVRGAPRQACSRLLNCCISSTCHLAIWG
jgi:hypothetical protein